MTRISESERMEAVIALGSNIDRERNMPAAIERLRAHPEMELVAVSSIYTTAAIGSDGSTSGQPAFANAAACIATTLAATELRRELRAIEAELGRVRTADRFAPRPIDLDIVLYGSEIMDVDGHHIPDRDVLHFAHIALPAADIAGDWIHPETGQTLATIAANAEKRRTGEITMKTNGIYRNGNGHNGNNGSYANGNGHNGNGHVIALPMLLAPERVEPRRYYDTNFVVTDKYRASLPDLQNGPASLIQGSPVAIQQVGIHNFRLPLRYASRTGEPLVLETSVTGTVSLEAHKKGINMSRVMRNFYEHKDSTFDLDLLEEILLDYRTSLGSLDAYLILRFNYPIVNESLRSGLAGYQYYQVALEARMDRFGAVRKFIHFDFVYSSTCPCSYELSQHAILERNTAAVPHSQRSVARVSVELNGLLWIEELRDLCLAALHTETQVMVKREDEQAFAELNAAYLKFVEDAVRLLHEQLDPEPRIKDFKVVASHQESLHSHDAISVLVKGVRGGFMPEIEPSVFATLIHR